MSVETEKSLERRETREIKENKENDPELQAAATMERADLLVKEIKQSKKQMQNIFLHMQQVMQAIRQLRAQLQLAANNDDPASVKQDKEMIVKLKKKIVDYGSELEKMRHDLVREQMDELKNGIGVGLSAEQLKQKAEEMVEEMMAIIKE